MNAAKKGKNDAELKLQQEWYQKLKDEGFNDIELNLKDKAVQTKRIGSNRVNSQFIRGHKKRFNGSHEYHLLCQAILREFKFKEPIYKQIFEFHTQGKSREEIRTILGSIYIGSITGRAISYIIERIKKEYQRDY